MRATQLGLSNKQMKPKRILTYLVPKQILDESLKYLHNYGKNRMEGYMCWGGAILKNSNAIIRNCIYPKPSELSSHGFLHAGVGLSAVFEIGEQVYEKREFLLAQLHTHAFEAFHSSIDNNFPISHKAGFISIVVPFFATKRFYNNRTLVNCSVNEYLGFGKWRELSRGELRKRFKVI